MAKATYREKDLQFQRDGSASLSRQASLTADGYGDWSSELSPHNAGTDSKLENCMQFLKPQSLP